MNHPFTLNHSLPRWCLLLLLTASLGWTAGISTEGFGHVICRFSAAQGVEAAESGKVAKWESTEGSPIVLAEAKEELQPRLETAAINGKPALLFGAQSSLAGRLPSSGRAKTYVLVCQIQAGNEPPELQLVNIPYGEGIGLRKDAFVGRWSPVKDFADLSLTEEETEKLKTQNRTLLIPDAAGDVFNPNIVVLEFAENGTRLFVNGHLQAEYPSSQPIGTEVPNGATMTLGPRRAKLETDFTGKIAEFILFGEALPADKRQALEKALGTEYGIPVNVP